MAIPKGLSSNTDPTGDTKQGSVHPAGKKTHILPTITTLELEIQAVCVPEQKFTVLQFEWMGTAGTQPLRTEGRGQDNVGRTRTPPGGTACTARAIAPSSTATRRNTKKYLTPQRGTHKAHPRLWSSESWAPLCSGAAVGATRRAARKLLPCLSV